MTRAPQPNRLDFVFTGWTEMDQVHIITAAATDSVAPGVPSNSSNGDPATPHQARQAHRIFLPLVNK